MSWVDWDIKPDLQNPMLGGVEIKMRSLSTSRTRVQLSLYENVLNKAFIYKNGLPQKKEWKIETLPKHLWAVGRSYCCRLLKAQKTAISSGLFASCGKVAEGIHSLKKDLCIPQGDSLVTSQCTDGYVPDHRHGNGYLPCNKCSLKFSGSFEHATYVM